MFKYFINIILIGFVVAGLVNCNKNTYHNPPKISFSNIDHDTMIPFGKTIKVGFDVSTNNYNVTNILIKLDTGSGFQTVFDTGMNVSNIHLNYFITKGASKIENYRFIARDIEGMSSIIELKIIKDSNNSFGEIILMKNVLLDAQGHEPKKWLFNTTLESSQTIEEAYDNQDKIDLVYYYSQIDENVIASPGANIEPEIFDNFPVNFSLENWTSRNTTRFKEATISVLQFDEIKNDSLLIVSYGSADGKRKAKSLQKDKIYSFKTQNSKFGIIKVNQIEGQAGGYILFDVIIQK